MMQEVWHDLTNVGVRYDLRMAERVDLPKASRAAPAAKPPSPVVLPPSTTFFAALQHMHARAGGAQTADPWGTVFTLRYSLQVAPSPMSEPTVCAPAALRDSCDPNVGSVLMPLWDTESAHVRELARNDAMFASTGLAPATCDALQLLAVLHALSRLGGWISDAKPSDEGVAMDMEARELAAAVAPEEDAVAHVLRATAMSAAAAAEVMPAPTAAAMSAAAATAVETAAPDEPEPPALSHNCTPIRSTRLSAPSGVLEADESALESVHAADDTVVHDFATPVLLRQTSDVAPHSALHGGGISDAAPQAVASRTVHWVNPKLARKLARQVLACDRCACLAQRDNPPPLSPQLRDPLAVASGALPHWCEQLVQPCPFLFPLDVRRQFFDASAFGVARSVYFLQVRARACSQFRAGTGAHVAP